MTVEQHQLRADGQATSLLARLDPKQDAHLASAVAYWQGLSTHFEMPKHTDSQDDSKVPDALSRRAGGHAESWDDFIPGTFANSTDCAFSASTYDGPSGMGYELRLEMVFDSSLYLRVINHGSETYREQPWTETGLSI